MSVKLSVFDYGLSVVQKKDQEDRTGRPIVLSKSQTLLSISPPHPRLASLARSDHTYFLGGFFGFFCSLSLHAMPAGCTCSLTVLPCF